MRVAQNVKLQRQYAALLARVPTLAGCMDVAAVIGDNADKDDYYGSIASSHEEMLAKVFEAPTDLKDFFAWYDSLEESERVSDALAAVSTALHASTLLLPCADASVCRVNELRSLAVKEAETVIAIFNMMMDGQFKSSPEVRQLVNENVCKAALTPLVKATRAKKAAWGALFGEESAQTKAAETILSTRADLEDRLTLRDEMTAKSMLPFATAFSAKLAAAKVDESVATTEDEEKYTSLLGEKIDEVQKEVVSKFLNVHADTTNQYSLEDMGTRGQDVVSKMEEVALRDYATLALATAIVEAFKKETQAHKRAYDVKQQPARGYLDAVVHEERVALVQRIQKAMIQPVDPEYQQKEELTAFEASMTKAVKAIVLPNGVSLKAQSVWDTTMEKIRDAPFSTYAVQEGDKVMPTNWIDITTIPLKHFISNGSFSTEFNGAKRCDVGTLRLCPEVKTAEKKLLQKLAYSVLGKRVIERLIAAA